MKKKYKAMCAMSLALTTAFISVNGVGVLKGNATTVGATYVDMTGIQNDGGLHSSNAGYVETSAGIDESNYGEWIIEREPTYEQDGLRKREYVASDGTFYVQYETIPRLPVPPVPSDPIPEPTRPSESGEGTRPLIPERNIATKSDASKSFGHTSGKKTRIENSESSKKGAKDSQSGNNNSDTKNSANNDETTESSAQKAENAKQSGNKSGHKHKRNDNDSVSKSEADKNVKFEVNTDSTITDNATENNTFTSLPDITETSTEISNKNEVINETVEASTNAYESIDENSSPDKSFNRYDGATLLAAGAYAWWIAIVLLPMINAAKWINKKRREKSRGNVNKKYN